MPENGATLCLSVRHVSVRSIDSLIFRSGRRQGVDRDACRVLKGISLLHRFHVIVGFGLLLRWGWFVVATRQMQASRADDLSIVITRIFSLFISGPMT